MKTRKKSNRTTVYVILALVLAAAGMAGIWLAGGQDAQSDNLAVLETQTPSSDADSADTEAAGKGVTINKSEITEKAAFYPYRSGDTDMEVIALRASDGTVRTAFNTCQVCYDSGRGYYVQDGDVLVCQNCGNRFGVDQVEVTKGGCNPVPIFKDQKTETEDTITISDDVMAEYKTLFSKWKK